MQAWVRHVAEIMPSHAAYIAANCAAPGQASTAQGRQVAEGVR
jgi:hypothetical protein